jgi:hypothetical protein
MQGAPSLVYSNDLPCNTMVIILFLSILKDGDVPGWEHRQVN